jgi:ribosomal protein S18 acetylase RimI-like enzyme
MVRLVQVDARDVAAFRALAEACWRELLPRADVVRDGARRAAYFQERCSWDGGPGHPRWALADGRRIGFVMFNVSDDRRVAHVHDFYVGPSARRRGHGGAMARELLAQLDRLGVRQVELNVRADNPRALAFGQAQGFDLALYRLRQYRRLEEPEAQP